MFCRKIRDKNVTICGKIWTLIETKWKKEHVHRMWFPSYLPLLITEACQSAGGLSGY